MYAELAEAAWRVRESSNGKTQVGAAVMIQGGRIFTGCNVEHRFRCHDVHAEVNALTNMAAAGFYTAMAVFIVAARDNFTPCGSCLDWIFELGEPNTRVCFQGSPSGPFDTYRARELMPHYPC